MNLSRPVRKAVSRAASVVLAGPALMPTKLFPFKTRLRDSSQIRSGGSGDLYDDSYPEAFEEAAQKMHAARNEKHGKSFAAVAPNSAA
ncbi:hypothetical protein [Caballeronia sp. M1242]|uniref:hypothetical protein n=1 Tax=Caballeronia sp. M1242 TaxID=2814653 RepID=UPI0019D17E4E|nr:hypothetical protein [Caballeronia sp. M1242]QSN64248.1 hypothetical protein JYK05_23385 [Caballeronia sp. M1242]